MTMTPMVISIQGVLAGTMTVKTRCVGWSLEPNLAVTV